MPTLAIDIAARLATFQDSLDKIGRQGEQLSGRLTKAFGTVKASLAGLAGGLSAGAFVSFIKTGIDAADSLGKLSQQLGVSTESLSALNFAASLSGSSAEELSQAMTKLAKAATDTAAGTGEALGAFKALGVSVKDAAGNLRGTEDLLLELADRFSKIEDGTGKTAIAMRLFGESGARLIPFLNNGRAGLQGLREEAEQLGIVIGGETARKAEAFNDNMQRLAAQSERFRVAMVENLIGPLARVAERMADAARSGGGFLGVLQAPFKLNDIELAEKQLGDLTDRLLTSERRLSEMRRTPLSDPTAKALEASIAADRQRAEELVKLLGVLRKETDAFGTPIKTEDGRKKPAPGLPPTSTGPDQGAQFLETLRKRLLAIEQDEYAVLRLEAAQKKVLASAEPLIAALQRQTEFQKQHAEAVQRDAAAQEAEQQRRFALVDGVAKYVEGLEEETALQKLSNEQRIITTQLLRLEQAGISKTSEEYAAAGERIRAAVNANAGAVLTRELRTPLEKANEEMQRLRDLFGSGAIGAVTFQRGVAAINEELNKTDSATQSAEDAVKSLGLTFSSAFEEAVAGGKSFRDILKGIESDLLKLGTRKLVTEPLLKSFEGLIGGGVKGLFGGNSASSVGYQNSFDNPSTGGGGGSGGFGDILGAIFSKFIGSFAEGTDYVPRDGFAMVHKGERIVTAEENRRGRGDINVTVRVDGNAMPSTRQSAGQLGHALGTRIARDVRRNG